MADDSVKTIQYLNAPETNNGTSNEAEDGDEVNIIYASHLKDQI